MGLWSFFQAQKSDKASLRSRSPEREQPRRCAPPARGSTATLRWTEERDQDAEDLRTSINEARAEQGYNHTNLLPVSSAQPSPVVSRETRTATSAEILRCEGRSASEGQRPSLEGLSAVAPSFSLNTLPPHAESTLSLTIPVTNYSVEPSRAYGILFLNPESYLFKECPASTLRAFPDIFDGETPRSPAEHIADSLKEILEDVSSAEDIPTSLPSRLDKSKGKQKLDYEDEELEAEHAARDAPGCGLGVSLEQGAEDSVSYQESSGTPPPAPRLASQPFPSLPSVPEIVISPAPDYVSSSDEPCKAFDPTRLLPPARRPVRWALENAETDNAEPLAEISRHMQSLSMFEYDSDSSEDEWSSDEDGDFEEFEEDEEWLAHPRSARKAAPKTAPRSAPSRALETIPEEFEGEVYEELLEKVLEAAPEEDPDEDPEAEEAAMRVFEAVAQGNLHKVLEKLHCEALQASCEEDAEVEEDAEAEKALENKVFNKIVHANLDLVLEELCEAARNRLSDANSEADEESDPEPDPEPEQDPAQPEPSPEDDSEPNTDSTTPEPPPESTPEPDSGESPVIPSTVTDAFLGLQPCATYDSDEEEVRPFTPKGKEILKDVRMYFNMPESTKPDKIQAYFSRNPELLRCLCMRTIPHPCWQFWHHSRLYEVKICRNTRKGSLRRMRSIAIAMGKLVWSDKKVRETIQQVDKAGRRGVYAGGKSATIEKMLLKTLQGRENPFLVRRQIELGAPAGRDVMARWNEQVRKRKNRMRSLLSNEVLCEE